jgi:hypothetical protein
MFIIILEHYIRSLTKKCFPWFFIHVERRQETVAVQARTSQRTPSKTERRLCLLYLDNLAVVFGAF